jgi:hypothetical protein
MHRSRPESAASARALALGAFLVNASWCVACTGGPLQPAQTMTPIDSSRLANTLTEAEATQFCHETVSYREAHFTVRDAQQYNCRIFAPHGAAVPGTAGDSRVKAVTACEEHYETCMAEPLPESSAGPDRCASAYAALQRCSASVAEISQCVADQIVQQRRFLDVDTCEHFEIVQSVPGPASCDAIFSRCKHMFDDVDDSQVSEAL